MRLLNLLLATTVFFLLINIKVSQTPVREKVFIPYVESLCVALKERGHSCRLIETVSIRKALLSKKLAGLYHPLAHEILVSTEVWDRSSNEVREQLVYHELGHALGLDHIEYGIMQSAGFINDTFYKTYRDIIIQEMLEQLASKPKEKLVTKADVLNNKHAVVRFTATWCPPCKALAPIFDEVAAANPDVVTYVIDVDQNMDLARDMGVRGLPTMIQVKDNAVSLSLVGLQSKTEVEKLFK